MKQLAPCNIGSRIGQVDYFNNAVISPWLPLTNNDIVVAIDLLAIDSRRVWECVSSFNIYFFFHMTHESLYNDASTSFIERAWNEVHHQTVDIQRPLLLIDSFLPQFEIPLIGAEHLNEPARPAFPHSCFLKLQPLSEKQDNTQAEMHYVIWRDVPCAGSQELCGHQLLSSNELQQLWLEIGVHLLFALQPSNEKENKTNHLNL